MVATKFGNREGLGSGTGIAMPGSASRAIGKHGEP
jgi:hypothetical protein